MEIEVVRQVNSRWHDGRSFAAMPGRRLVVDDDDQDLVAHMRYLVGLGDVVEVVEEAVPTVDPHAPDGGNPPELVNKMVRKPSAAKAAIDE